MDANQNNIPTDIISPVSTDFFNTPEHLQFILQHLDNGILVQDAAGMFLYCNPSASSLLGFNNQTEMMQHLRDTAHILQDGYHYKDLAGNPIQTGQWPWAKTTSGYVQNELMVNLSTKDDTFLRRLHIHTYLTHHQEERHQLIISTITDMTQSALLEKQKDEFMSLASHELKTPITSMKIFTQALLRSFQDKPDAKPMQYLGKIEGQLNKLTVLIKEMLEVSRLQTGRLQLHEELFSIDTLIHEIAQQMQFTTDDHTIVCRGETYTELYADKERVGQVMMNLISNAIKYSPSYTTISLDWEVKNNAVVIRVSDQGPGISEDRQKHIFDRFAKNGDATESTFPGMGVGLYIASEFIKRHNGTIAVHSQKDKGSVFTITLPIKHT